MKQFMTHIMKHIVVILSLLVVFATIDHFAWAGLETGTYLDDLVVTNPTSSDSKSEGDDHIRLIKTTLVNTFPNLSGAVTPTQTELNYVDGVTSAIQTQIDTKAPTASPTFTGTATAPTFSGALSGNAATASKWQTARTVQLSGDVTGSASLDGSASINISATVGNNSHTHNSSTISDLDAGDVTTGTFATARIPTNISVASASTATYATSAGSASNATTVNSIHIQQYNIGTWNMDSSVVVYINGSFPTPSKIISVSFTLVDDTENYVYDDGFYGAVGSPEAWISEFTSTRITVRRVSSGSFDGIDFDSTSINRGYVTILYID